MSEELRPCPFCGMGLTLDIDEEGGVAILHSLKGEKNCWFPSIVEIEMPVETTLEEMVEILNRRPIQESFEHALVGTSLVDAARLQDKYFEIQDLNAELARRDEIITRLKEDAERLAWISIANGRLPEKFQECIVLDKNKRVHNWIHDDALLPLFAQYTHWMPLPEPPEGGER